MNRQVAETQFTAQEEAVDHDLEMPIPFDEVESRIVAAYRRPTLRGYVLLAASPLSCFGAHLAYARGRRLRTGCLGCTGLFFVLGAVGAAQTLLGLGSGRNLDGAEVFILLLVGIPWLFGILSAVRWTRRGEAMWRRRQVSRATEAIEILNRGSGRLQAAVAHQQEKDRREAAKRRAEIFTALCRDPERKRVIQGLLRGVVDFRAAKQAEEFAKRERMRAEQKRIRQEAARARQERESQRDAALAELYGGRHRFLDLVRRRELALDMTEAAVRAVHGSPVEVKREETASRRVERFLYKPTKGSRGKVTYGLEVTLVNGIVTKIKEN